MAEVTISFLIAIEMSSLISMAMPSQAKDKVGKSITKGRRDLS